MIDIGWTSREVTRDDETVAVVLRRDFPSPVDDVWDALTDPERLKRWFLPVSGDLPAGGTFATEGGAGGDDPDLRRSRFSRSPTATRPAS